MGFKEFMKDCGGASLTFLSEDGERVVFMVAGNPVLIEGKFARKDTKRVGVPIVTIEGFSLLTIGMRVARRLSKHDGKYKETLFELIRHGESGDTKTAYSLTVLQDDHTLAHLMKIIEVGIDDDELKAAIEEATKLANT